MAVSEASQRTQESVLRILQEKEPGTILLPSRLLRRVIKIDRQIPGIGMWVPHRQMYSLSRETFLELVDEDEIPAGTNVASLPERILLLEEIDASKLAQVPQADILLHYWKLLFHMRVHRVLEERIEKGELSVSGLRQRCHEIGQVVYDEIRTVLRQEEMILPPADRATYYIEFAAVYFELRLFTPALVSYYFPAVKDQARIEKILNRDLDAKSIYEATHLEGATEPISEPASEIEDTQVAEESRKRIAGWPQLSRYRRGRLLKKASKANRLGNSVRAAVTYRLIELGSPSGEARRAENQMLRKLDDLVRRLQTALHWDESTAAAWREGLLPLLQVAPRGTYTVETRLLFDLQNLCIDHERELYTVDLVEWALSWGRRPIKRPLPNLREVLTCRHLRRASGRLVNVAISDTDRETLSALLEQATSQAETQLRKRHRVLIADAFETVGLQPANLPERIALGKIVEELLDSIVRDGFLSMASVRDALSRNNLKLPDLSGFKEFFQGDLFLKLDKELAHQLDGVYRRGEFYLRWQQSISSVAFGTKPGRFITRYLVLPFGGAFVILEAFKHIGHLIEGEAHHNLDPTHVTTEQHISTEAALWEVGLTFILGLFLMGVLYQPDFRDWILTQLHKISQNIRGFLLNLPQIIARFPPIRVILESDLFRWTMRFFILPLIATVTFSGLVQILYLPIPLINLYALTFHVSLFVGFALVLNSRIGRDLEEFFIDGLVQGWYHVSTILPGMFRLIMEVSKKALESIERVLYAVDEWLRFRKGESRFQMAAKALLGFFWFFVTYVVRFCVNLLIEPQVNPIKHFPVVTVSHKIMLGFAPTVSQVITPLAGSVQLAGSIVVTIFFLVPGIFGYLVWELKENWKLYEGNRSRHLQPVHIGHHGETLARLLRPGFHSGTLPKIFARLRQAERGGYRKRNWSKARKQLQALHHLEIAMRDFIEREFISLLEASQGFGKHSLTIEMIELASNTIDLHLGCPELSDQPMVISFEEQSGWIAAQVCESGWLDQLSESSRHAFQTALAGLYKMSGVELIREQIEAQFEPDRFPYDIAREGLIVWPEETFSTEAIYRIDPRENENSNYIAPRTTANPAPLLPSLQAQELLYDRTPLEWKYWVDTWEYDQRGGRPQKSFLHSIRLLPDHSTI
ncbi:Hypothetical protein PBC10988_18310 [Planctomycetales bacterium 10988]|nr:Hypothetical protein PBC10988_18310 [Planctomycetales bacterium 10988]